MSQAPASKKSKNKLPSNISSALKDAAASKKAAAQTSNTSYSDSYSNGSTTLTDTSIDSSADNGLVSKNTNGASNQSNGNNKQARREVDGYKGPALHGRRLSEIGSSDNLKLLFLDVDGVLNYENSDERLCLPQMMRLKRIIELTQCKVVLSTSWRVSPKRKERLLNTLKSEAQIDVDTIVIGSTPSFKGQYGYHHRPLEIYEFLTHNEELYVYNNYKVVSWVAIDDLELSEYNNTIMKGHFVKTDLKTGLTDNDVDRAVKILNKEDVKEHIRLRSLHKEIFGSDPNNASATPSATPTATPTTEDTKSQDEPGIASLMNAEFAKAVRLEEKEDVSKVERVKLKLLFLNIDGVLNTDKYISQVNNGMSPDHLARLKKILDKTECKIVFSTNRRLQALNKEKALKQLERKISESFVKEYFVGDTPHLQYQCRPFEIQRFLDDIENYPFVLSQGNKKVFFDVISWCAVDDTPLDKMNTECWNIMNGRFVKTDPQFGMTDAEANDIIKILNEETGLTKHKPTNSKTLNGDAVSASNGTKSSKGAKNSNSAKTRVGK